MRVYLPHTQSTDMCSGSGDGVSVTSSSVVKRPRAWALRPGILILECLISKVDNGNTHVSAL